MSVTLINIFEVPAGDEDEFIAAWEKTRDYLKTFPAHIETALHQSLHDTQFRFVNIAHWTSEDEFNAAVGSQEFREAVSDLRWPSHPALYQVVRTGQKPTSARPVSAQTRRRPCVRPFTARRSATVTPGGRPPGELRRRHGVDHQSVTGRPARCG
jgi:heme-degrading monooxygenase HmoA